MLQTDIKKSLFFSFPCFHQVKAPSASPSYTTVEAPNTLGGITEIFNTIHNSYWGTSKSQRAQSPTNETQENVHTGFIEG